MGNKLQHSLQNCSQMNTNDEEYIFMLVKSIDWFTSIHTFALFFQTWHPFRRNSFISLRYSRKIIPSINTRWCDLFSIPLVDPAMAFLISFWGHFHGDVRHIEFILIFHSSALYWWTLLCTCIHLISYWQYISACQQVCSNSQVLALIW